MKAGTLAIISPPTQDAARQDSSVYVQTRSVDRKILFQKIFTWVTVQMAAEVEETLKRLVGHKGVIGTVVVNKVCLDISSIVFPPQYFADDLINWHCCRKEPASSRHWTRARRVSTAPSSAVSSPRQWSCSRSSTPATTSPSCGSGPRSASSWLCRTTSISSSLFKIMQTE